MPCSLGEQTSLCAHSLPTTGSPTSDHNEEDEGDKAYDTVVGAAALPDTYQGHRQLLRAREASACAAGELLLRPHRCELLALPSSLLSLTGYGCHPNLYSWGTWQEAEDKQNTQNTST